jgi:hypothetical protein
LIDEDSGSVVRIGSGSIEITKNKVIRKTVTMMPVVNRNRSFLWMICEFRVNKRYPIVRSNAPREKLTKIAVRKRIKIAVYTQVFLKERIISMRGNTNMSIYTPSLCPGLLEKIRLSEVIHSDA